MNGFLLRKSVLFGFFIRYAIDFRHRLLLPRRSLYIVPVRSMLYASLSIVPSNVLPSILLPGFLGGLSKHVNKLSFRACKLPTSFQKENAPTNPPFPSDRQCVHR